MSTAGDIILSVRSQIPDPTAGDDPNLDGNAFKLATLLRWINDAGRLICISVPVIQDWYGVRTLNGQDVYELPDYITSIEQAWYDLLPLSRAPEYDSIFTSKINARSWWFGPHSIHATPRIHVWPAPDANGATTTLSANLTATATSASLTSASGFNAYGFAKIVNEVVRYATVNTTTNVISNLLRGQGGTLAAAANTNDTVDELNLFFKCSRLPRPLTKVGDPYEIPQGLWPLVELYVIAKVRESEQDHATALQLRQEFHGLVDKLGANAQLKGLRQGIQIKTAQYYPNLFRGRVFIP